MLCERSRRKDVRAETTARSLTMSVRFEVQAHQDPQTLCRLLNFAAKIGHVPWHVRASCVDGMIHAMIELRGLSPSEVNIIAEKMRASVLVDSVRVENLTL